MDLTLKGLERQRDLGLFVLRVVAGGTYVVYGYVKMAGGAAAWERIGAAVEKVGASGGHLYWGLAASLAELVGGLLLVLGLWVRPAALALCATMVMASLVQWSAVRWGTMTTVSAFFYALTMAAVMFGLLFLGGGRFGLDGGGGSGGRAKAAAKEK